MVTLFRLARGIRISASVALAQSSQPEEQLGVKLFQRTAYVLNPTELDKAVYPNAQKIQDAVALAQTEIHGVTLGLRRIRLRLFDQKMDLALEGVDVASFLGVSAESSPPIRKIAGGPSDLCPASA